MQVILSDHNCEGQCQQLIYALARIGLAEIAPLQLRRFRQVGLPQNAPDEVVWQLCQDRSYLLITGNRRTVDGDDSLELTILRNYTPTILPVITIGNLTRLQYDRDYCDVCAERLAEIVLDLDNHRGNARLYIP